MSEIGRRGGKKPLNAPHPPTRTYLLEHLRKDGHRGIYRVGDNQIAGIRRHIGCSLSNSLDDAGVDVEEVITSHAGLAGHTGGDDNHIAALQRGLDGLRALEASDLGREGDVGQVGSDTRGVHNVVQVELLDAGVQLEQHGQGLSNASRRPDHRDLGSRGLGGGEGARGGHGGRAEGCASSKHDWRWWVDLWSGVGRGKRGNTRETKQGQGRERRPQPYSGKAKRSTSKAWRLCETVWWWQRHERVAVWSSLHEYATPCVRDLAQQE